VNKKQLVKMIREQRPEPPVGYEARMEARLARLVKEEIEMKRKHRVSIALTAAVLIVLLAGTALALGYSGLMEYLQKGVIKPLDGAEEMIQTEFDGETMEAQETDEMKGERLVEFKVEEAIYDGRSVIVQALITPVHPEEYALFNAIFQDASESMYDQEIVREENGVEWMRVTGRKDGRKIIHWNADLKQKDEDAGYWFDMNTKDAEELEDGSIRVWMEGTLLEGIADVIDLKVICSSELRERMNATDWTGDLKRISREISLTSTAAARTARLVPAGEAKGERFEILGVWLEFNPVKGRITIDYSYLPDRTNEPMGIDFRVYDGDGNRIALGDGRETIVEVREDGTEINRSIDEMQAFEEFPETIWLEAKVIGEERTLGRVEFSVEEGAVDIPSAEAAGREEREPDGLILEPENAQDWKGERFTLLGGRISAGMKVEIEFAHGGNPKEMAGVEVRYLHPDGTKVGEVIDSAGVIGEEAVRRTDRLDGSWWPTEMTIEFVKDGMVVDSFVCRLHGYYE